ncbi:Afadin and alpha-actinin-binding-domain-containing protein [Xylaria bambusicola]|uniref:Afadin and alpha-actinin-binding-domain-containing protein n=1 Tax=Xylaria bambusicola TaxID=326684 RepID=UPI002008BA22|nr:Afadin and alpha-actinin-binding-domain-containing protein [Xylaria bambusicola]KAI0528154.1 Afadin and alpha-actinin-binding-domain-containing protein [Xylaria bambusicola]
MIDPNNLRTASLYINNQLLSRGLLRDGQSIDFADPEGSDGGLQDAMGRIIGVVNDLILRRDRDAEHRESLSSTLRTLRTDIQRQTTEYARQTEKLDDTQRRLDTAEATERALRAQLKTAEQGIHNLKDQVAKMKSVVAQTRNACANEVRKRDRHIDSLKKAVTDAGRVRGSGKNRDVITINVTGSDGNEEGEGMGMPVGATEDEGYSLRMETNGFLTELAKGLSEENEGLLTLVRDTISGLREMSGLDRNIYPGDEQSHDSVRNEFVTQLPQKSAEELATEIQAIVEHLRSILTNPSFVPIEEVEARDEVIAGLRARLNTTLAKWKDTMLMIDGWRRRMESSGKSSVDVEDLLLSLSPVRVRDAEETANVQPMRLSCVQEEEEEEEEEEEMSNQNQRSHDETSEPQHFRSRSSVESLRLVPAPAYDEDPDDESDSDSSIFQDDLDDDIDIEEPNVQILQTSTADSIDSSPLPEPPKISPLKDSYSSGNRGAVHTSPYHKRPGDFTTIVEENTWDLAATGEKQAPASPSYKSKVSPPRVDDDGMPSYTASYDSPLFGKSGERPTEADLNRKLFSKPSEPRPRSTAIGTTLSQRNQISPPQATQTTRANAKKVSEKTSPTAAIRRVVDTDEDIAHSTAPSTNTSTSTSISTSTSTTTTSNPSTTTTTTTTSQRKRPAQQQNPSSTNSEEPDNRDRDSNKHPRTRSPTRAHQNAAVSSRLPRPHAQQQHQSPLNMATIAAKLAASEREADAARVRAKLRAVRRNRRISGAAPEGGESSSPPNGQRRTQAQTQAQKESVAQRAENSDGADIPIPRENVDPVKKDKDVEMSMGVGVGIGIRKAPRRRYSRATVGDDVDELGDDDYNPSRNDARTGEGEEGEEGMDGDKGPALSVAKNRRNRAAVRAGKVASRRRSTLSPWELQGLISGSVESPRR